MYTTGCAAAGCRRGTSSMSNCVALTGDGAVAVDNREARL
jgi:hypothetical protein